MPKTKIVILLLLLTLFSYSTNAITINSQAELEATFDSTTTFVGGDLLLFGDDISDLSPLANLTTVVGEFYISGTILVNLNGLENLQAALRLFISENDVLESAHLPSFSSIFGELVVHDNEALLSVTGSFPDQMDNSIYIYNNPLLEDISILEGVSSAGGLYIFNNPNINSLSPIKDFTILDNLRLENFHFIENLENIPVMEDANTIALVDFPLVSSIAPLAPTLSQGMSRLKLSDFPLLTSLDPLLAWDFPINRLELYTLGLVENLIGFNNIPDVNYFEIVDNPMLSQLDFNHISQLSSLYISGCDTLTSINGFTILDTATCINISACNNLKDLSDFNQVSILFGSCSISFTFTLNLKDLPALENQFFFPNLKSVNGNLVIQNCGLDSLYGFSELISVASKIQIKENEIVDMAGFDKLAHCEDIYIADNQNLTNINISDSLGTIYSDLLLWLYNNPELDSITGGDNITRLFPFFADNPKLEYFPLLPTLERWTGFYIYNSKFQNFDFASAADTCGGAILIENNPFLENLNGFSNIINWKLYEFVDYLVIQKNPLLQTLQPFHNYPGPEFGAIEVRNNDLLSDLSGFENIQNISFWVDIVDNPNLTSLTGLENLSHIGDTLTINNNATLQDISALSNIDTIGLELRITNNPLLANCEVLCTLDSFAYIHGGIMLSNNDSISCSDIDSVLYFCENPISSLLYELEENKVLISPNPSSGDLTIDFGQFQSGFLDLINFSGQLIERIPYNDVLMEIDISDYAAGIYLLRVTDMDGRVLSFGKVVKVD